MPASRRMYEHNRAYFVTNRTAEGLPFVACLYINLLLYGILARACKMYPDVTVCAWIFLPNHYHGIVVTRGDPAVLRLFMNFVDGETAKLVVRLLGKRHYKVWAQTYHAALLLDKDAAIRAFTYLFLNPVRALFVDKASDWHGVTTFDELIGKGKRKFKYVPPSKIARLPRGGIPRRLMRALIEEFKDLSGVEIELEISPFAWKQCFAATKTIPDSELREVLLQHIRTEEAAIRARRIREKQTVIGMRAVSSADAYQSYRPKQFGRRVFCISTDADIRKEFIEHYRRFCERCVAAWQAWKVGDFTKSYPAGAFLPSQPPRISIVPLRI